MGKVTFPKIGEKHNFIPLIVAEHTLEGKERVPRRAVLIYSAAHFPEKLRKHLSLHKYNKGVDVSGAWKPSTYLTSDKKLLIIKLPAGAPSTAMAVEEARANGAKEFLILGTAGGLRKELQVADVVLCTGAVRDEGTSHHYIRESEYAFPDRRLTAKLERQLIKNKIAFHKGTTWSIDAPFAETREEVKHYQKKGVLTVEMEAAALFAVAEKRRVKAAAIFTISDKLDKEWSGFQKEYKESGYDRLARIAKLFKDMK